MNGDDFIKNDLDLIEQSCYLEYNEDSLCEGRSKKCNKNLGEFIFKARNYTSSNIPPDKCFSLDCSPCNMIEDKCVDIKPSFEGRLMTLDINLRNIYSNKILVVGILVYEDNKLCAFKFKKIHTGYCNCKKYKIFSIGKFCCIFNENPFYNQSKIKVKVIYNYTKA